MSWIEFDYEDRNRRTMTEEVPLWVYETERTAQQDLMTVLRLIDAGKMRVIEKTQRAAQAGAKTITEVLAGGDFYEPVKPNDPWETQPGAIKAFAWPLIVRSAILVSPSVGKLQLTPAGKKALIKGQAGKGNEV